MDTDKEKKTSAKAYNPEITEEDRQALGKKDLSMDALQDRLLEEREEPIDFTGADLDLPVADGDSTDGQGIPDEENRVFSSGGARSENLEERKGSALDRNIDPGRKARKNRQKRLNDLS